MGLSCGDILIIGFGRFGQIASQALLAKGHKISLIDTDTEMIRVAAIFGAKVYYGDGTRLDILRAAGIEKVDVVIIAIDKKDARRPKIAEPNPRRIPADQGHGARLRSRPRHRAGQGRRRLPDSRSVRIGAAAQRATTLRLLGSTDEEIAELIQGVRERDRQRFAAQIVGGIAAGRDLLLSNAEEQARESGAAEGPSEPRSCSTRRWKTPAVKLGEQPRL